MAKGLMPNVITPNAFILLRVSGAALLFWMIFSFNYEKIQRADWLRIFACALFGVAVNQLFFFNGLMLTSPLNSSIIMTSTPIIVFVLSIIILKEKPTIQKIAGVILGAIGACTIIVLSTNTAGSGSTTGDILVFINATSFSIYMVLVKPLMQKYKPLTVITWVFTFGLILVLLWPASTTELMDLPYQQWLVSDFLKIAFVIVGVTFLPYLLTVVAMKIVSPSVASSYIYMQPVLVTVFIVLLFYIGVIDYSSDLSFMKLLAGILVFVGVYLVSKRK